jgi:hypothetical protein
LPEPGIYGLHAVWRWRVAPARLVRRKQDVGPKEGRRPAILDQVVVPADQDSDTHSPRCVDDGETISARNGFMLKRMKLAMKADRSRRASKSRRN